MEKCKYLDPGPLKYSTLEESIDANQQFINDKGIDY